jgi:membrane protein YdbS with pleckstrin-like domain
MKPCPFCAEEIQDAAIKCRHCGSMLVEAPAEKRAPRELPVAELYRGSPSWKAQLGSHLAAGALVAAALAALVVVPRAFDQTTTVGLAAAAPLALAGIVWFVALWLQRFVQFRITTRGIDVESGIIGKRIETVQLWKVRDLSFEQSVWDRVLGLARIRVFTQDVTSPTMEIGGLPASREIFERLKGAVEIARRAGGVVGVIE